jgi:hypothetical protein
MAGVMEAVVIFIPNGKVSLAIRKEPVKNFV